MCLFQEVSQLEEDKAALEQELSAAEVRYQRERQQLLRGKEQERRQAVQDVQDQCEQDYKTFLNEHQHTLNKALKAAREQFARDKVNNDGLLWFLSCLFNSNCYHIIRLFFLHCKKKRERERACLMQ